MTKRTQSSICRYLASAMTLLAASVLGSVAFAEEPTLKEIADASRQRAAQDRAETVAIILHRQRGDQLNVYLNSRGAYVNGRSVSADLLTSVIKQSGLEAAVLTAEPYLAEYKVNGWMEVIRNAGIDQIQQHTAKKHVVNTKEKLREILSRQRTDFLQVYLKGESTYVNGRSISSAELATLVKESGMQQIVVTSEPNISSERLAEAEKLIRAAGGRGIQLTMPRD